MCVHVGLSSNRPWSCRRRPHVHHGSRALSEPRPPQQKTVVVPDPTHRCHRHITKTLDSKNAFFKILLFEDTEPRSCVSSTLRSSTPTHRHGDSIHSEEAQNHALKPKKKQPKELLLVKVPLDLVVQVQMDSTIGKCNCVIRSTGKMCTRTARKVHTLDKSRRVCGLHVKAPLPPPPPRPTTTTHSKKDKTSFTKTTIDDYFVKKQPVNEKTKIEPIHVHILLLWVMHVLTWIVMGVCYYYSSQAAPPLLLPVAGRLPPWLLRFCY